MEQGRNLHKSQAAALEALAAAFAAAQVGGTKTSAGRRGSQALAVVQAQVDDRLAKFAVEVVSYCTGQRARDLVAGQASAKAEESPLVVAEKITTEARGILSDAGWSWLDRRGHLHVHAPGIRIDTPVPFDAGAQVAKHTPAIAGRSGITVAYWLCAHPGESLSPTKHADELDLAPSSISTTVQRLRDAGLVSQQGSGVFPELFWELAEKWRAEHVWLSGTPEPSTQPSTTQMSNPQAAWRRTSSVAAAAYGAPIVTSEDGPMSFYTAARVDLALAAGRYGTAPPGKGTLLSVAPTSLALAPPNESVPVVGGWSLAPVLVVALDLAQDRGRGREILSQWKRQDAIWH